MKKFTAKSAILCLLSVLLSPVCSAQSEFNAREFFIEAESYFLFEEYNDALPLYQRILRNEPENYNVMYKIGVCYLNDPYQKDRSIKYLQDASDHINLKFKNNSYKEKSAPPDVLYYLGQAYRVTEQLNKAIESYNKFKNIVDPAVYNLDVVNAELASCESAKRSMKRPVYTKYANMGEGVNSRFAEVNPVFSADGKAIVFSRKLQFYDAVFISTLNSNGTWSPPYNLTPDFGLDGNSYPTGISNNGDEIFVYRSDNFDGNIYHSKKVDGKWQPLKKLNEFINTKYWESHASISADGQQLYFTSNRKGGYGGLDIYRSSRTSSGDWGQPVNLGPAINSVYNEESPFLSPADNKLYFSSLGHDGIGGYDVFVSERISGNKWSKPSNMGYPLNTTDDDLFFCPVNIAGMTGVLSSYKSNNTYGLKDIYWLEVYNDVIPRNYTVSGQVNVPEAALLNDEKVKISLINNDEGKIVSQSVLDSSGVFEINATQGDYQLLVDGEGIKPVTVPLSLTLEQESSAVNLAVITAVAAAAGEDVLVVTPSKVPELEVVGDEYLIVDTIPVTIDLNVEPGSDLKVTTVVGASVVKEEEYLVTKDKFSYVLTPQPGENTVLFLLTDSNGNQITREVTVFYKPQVAPLTELPAEPNIEETAVAGLAGLAGAGLGQYLLTLGDVNFETKADLYSTLIANADNNDYTKDDVDRFFALMLTQRDKEEFLEQMDNTPDFEGNMLSDTVLEKIDYPIAIVHDTKETYQSNSPQINNGLIKIIPIDESHDAELEYILTFISAGSVMMPERGVEELSYDIVLSIVGDTQLADSAIDLASTTQALDYYYQNLLVSADGKIKELLNDVNFVEDDIQNSIQLTTYLLASAPDYNISPEELVLHIEKANLNKSANLRYVKESLALAATGQLKTYVEGLDLQAESIETYEDLIANILANSRTYGYSTGETYEMLLTMLGYESVSDLRHAMLTKSTIPELDSILNKIDNQQVSTQLELIQHLLAQSANFDYTDSDINNLLLRLLLEKGIESYNQKEALLQAEKMIKKKKAITVIILANSLIILLIILFWRRSKKKQ